MCKNLTAMLTIFTCASLVGCSEAGKSSARPPAAKSAQFGPVKVSGRAAKPTDVEVGGIDVVAKDLEFGAGPTSVVISHDDWNTIIATSHVPIDVGLMLDPGYNADDLIRNRFQYLADRISLLGISKFTMIGIISSPAYGKYMSTVAIYNPTDQVAQISGLSVRISSSPPNITIANDVFYSESRGGCLIPAHTIYFAYLAFSRFSPMPPTSTSISYHLSALNLISCPGQVCATATPIAICQE